MGRSAHNSLSCQARRRSVIDDLGDGDRARPLGRLHNAVETRYVSYYRRAGCTLLGRNAVRSPFIIASLLITVFLTGAEAQQPGRKTPTILNPPPTAQNWADLAKLPDWSGVWNPKITDQDAQAKTSPPPWNAKVANEIEHMWA